MFERADFAEELILREQIRKAIKIVSLQRDKRYLQERKEEDKLRQIIRDILTEGQAAVASASRHDSTGINALEDLLRNSNVLFVLETGYKSLTTDKAQRDSYRNHILSAVTKSLAPEESRKEAGEDVEITEDVEIDIGDRPEDDPDFISVDDEEPVEVEVDEKEEFGITGADKTGRNRAFTDFQDIEKVVLTSFDDLDNAADMSMFEEYLIKNLALYFDKYENELATHVEEPAAAADAVPGGPGTGDGGEEMVADEDIASIELQEVLEHLNINDIIENLL
jgi:hypothetical protein